MADFTKIEIAVCDDNVHALRALEQELRGLGCVDNVHTFSNLTTFMFTVDGGKIYDVVLMDIDWGENSAGMDVAAELYKLSPETKIVYVTGYVDVFSQQIFLHQANLCGFLVKPVDAKLLRANLDRVVADLTYVNHPALLLKQRGALTSIPFREIFFIRSCGHIVEVHTKDEAFTAYERLENIKGLLPEGFYQCHKSYIVNMGQVRRFGSREILLKNGEIVPISRSRCVSARAAYFSYMGRRV